MGRLAITGLVSFLAAAGAVGCGGESASGALSTGGAGGGGLGGQGGTTSGGTTTTPTMSTTTTTTTLATSVSSSGSGGSGEVVCDPPAPANSLYALEDEGLFDIGKSTMCKYQGDVLLIVNTAGA